MDSWITHQSIQEPTEEGDFKRSFSRFQDDVSALHVLHSRIPS